VEPTERGHGLIKVTVAQDEGGNEGPRIDEDADPA